MTLFGGRGWVLEILPFNLNCGLLYDIVTESHADVIFVGSAVKEKAMYLRRQYRTQS